MDRWRPSRDREYMALLLGTNLCQFFRTLLWGAMIGAWSIALWAYMAFVALVLPFLLFNVTSIAMHIAIVFGMTSAFISIIVALFMIPNAASWIRTRISNITTNENPDRPPGFLRVCWRYIVGIKNRFCPTITFKENDHA